MEIIASIQNRIYEVRGERVMLDRDLALLYETPTKSLNLAVKRNSKRFPADFMFQLSKDEYDTLRFQFETSKSKQPLQVKTIANARGGTRYLPYVFTEQGVAMLSGLLNSEKAISMNITIMRAFVSIRRIVLKQETQKDQIKAIKEKLDVHDIQLTQIYDALENLLDEKAAGKKWEDRERIGFKTRK